MSATQPRPLCLYRYDPLDRLASRMLAGQPGQPCFYQHNRLVTEIQEQIARSWLQVPSGLLTQLDREAGKTECLLIAADLQGSVLQVMDTDLPRRFAYTPYGHRHPQAAHLPGFNRERMDPLTGHYLLGNGYRAFNPVLMRFHSPDNESPFEKKALNAYAYTSGNPANRTDPSGHLFNWIKSLFRPELKTIVPENTVWRELLPGIFDTKLTKNGATTHFITGHGEDPRAYNAPIIGGHDGLYTPEHLHRRILALDRTTKDTSQFHLLFCYSGSTCNNYSSRISQLTGKPVKGYEGVFIGPEEWVHPATTSDRRVTTPLGRDHYLFRKEFSITTKNFGSRYPGAQYKPRLIKSPRYFRTNEITSRVRMD